MGFKKDDHVISKSEWSNGKKGIVNKVSDLGIHVKFLEKNMFGEKFIYEIFRHEVTHRLHSSIQDLELIQTPENI